MKTVLISDRELTKGDPLLSQESFAMAADDELLDAYSKTIRAVVSRVAPSVVNIRVTTKSGRAGGGSGFIIARDTFILTNSHVVQGATTLEVTLHDGRSYPAEIVEIGMASPVMILRGKEKLFLIVKPQELRTVD